MQLTDSAGEITQEYDYDAFGVEKDADTADANPFRYCGEYFDAETGAYYLRARYYTPTLGRFTSEDTHWNPKNMVYGDNYARVNATADALGIAHYTYTPDVYAIRQSMNLYRYCGNDPLTFLDPTGNAWYHWVLGGVLVAAAAAAVVVTAGGALPAVYAVSAVASGAAAATAASTVAAGAFIGSAAVYGTMTLIAALDSTSIQDFNEKGSWGTLFYTAGAAGLGGLAGYLAYRSSEEHNIFSNKTFTNQTKTGVSNFESSAKGLNAAKADFYELKPTKVTTYSNGTIVGYLPDGTIANIHPGHSVGNRPTLEIFSPDTGEKIKIRY